MKSKDYIGNYSYMALLITLCITKIMISVPNVYIKHSHTAGWLEVLISGIFELFILAIILRLGSCYKTLNLLKISELIFGKTGKRITALISIAVIVFSSAAVFRSFSEMVRSTILRGISYETTAFYILAGGIFAAYLGIRTIGNVNGLVLPGIIVSIMLILSINYSRLSVGNIQPILGLGFSNVVSNALLKNASFYEIGTILLLPSAISDENDVKRNGFKALSISVIIITLVTLVYQLAVPYRAAGSFALPLYQMTRMIKAGTFFQRIEPLNMFIWSWSVLIYVGVGIWIAANIFKQAFDLYDYRPLIYMFGIIICTISLIPGSEIKVEEIYSFILTYSYIAYPILPLALLILGRIINGNKRGIECEDTP